MRKPLSDLIRAVRHQSGREETSPIRVLNVLACVACSVGCGQLHHDEIVPCALFTAATPFLERCSVVLHVRTRNEKRVIKDREKTKVPLVPFPLKARTLTSHTSADSSLFFTVRAT